MYCCNNIPISKIKFSSMKVSDDGNLMIFFEVWHKNTTLHEVTDTELITTFGFSLFHENIFELF